jgi:hypothetical protein
MSAACRRLKSMRPRPRPCLGVRGARCPSLTRDASGRCDACWRQHQRQRDLERGGTAERGYGTDHRQLRDHWAPRVATAARGRTADSPSTLTNLGISATMSSATTAAPNTGRATGLPVGRCASPARRIHRRPNPNRHLSSRSESVGRPTKTARRLRSQVDRLKAKETVGR